ncbi:uncharacterized protein TRIADDRAFT_27868 [Trichoplax adhaerens]|uniref:Uncharacterized protein n=1 Tax=Trichoplax adhaerens TaxID=10228 RepID=B3S235_TRIAD|nr:hypothetical protein TRIADDRAFT_27868 [Trichoplax adhaerens]EDV23363.1 hypothetical protein TRIADDRAFT_27868 [Trichoplax adhaerens]|eukprot:XP_002114273.1 hypothetical protein TRIADDRAFT_27868 [Trichoplax adhaerens]
MKAVDQFISSIILVVTLTASLVQGQILDASVRDLAPSSSIAASATCGTNRPENFCLLDRPDSCSTCDNTANAPSNQRHPIGYAIDGTEKWWQSPTLTNGFDYNNVTITLDLKQIFRVTYIILATANSPAPARWVLERSLDGRSFTAWQYYAQSESECYDQFKTETNPDGIFSSDSQVICVTTGIVANQFQNAQVIAQFLTGRPGSRISGYTEELRNFLSARYVRLRLLQIRTLGGDIQSPEIQDASYFYSIKGITVSGECMCNGHARRCEYSSTTDSYSCLCERNTCGPSCDRCCDSFIQKSWKPAAENSSNACEPCQCFNHTNQCLYNQTIADQNQSLDIHGNYQGGGICQNCQHNTEGINCQRCKYLYYRPTGVSRSAIDACQACGCNAAGIRDEPGRPTGSCIRDEEEARSYPQMNSGDCFCKQYVTGSKCDRCAIGFDGFPICSPCRCNPFGSVNSTCQSTNCQCKPNVQGSGCRQCKPGTYGLDNNDPVGCTKCYCFNLTSTCSSSNLVKKQVSSLSGWKVYDVRNQNSFSVIVQHNRLNYNLTDGADTFHWQAPNEYTGNLLTSYGENFRYTLQYVTTLTVTREFRPEIVIIGSNGMRLRNQAQPLKFDVLGEVQARLLEVTTDLRRKLMIQIPLTREQFMMTLNHVTGVFIRLSFISNQRNSYVSNITLTKGIEGTYSSDGTVKVEKCQCPTGYAGLSCERCTTGYRRENGQLNGKCIPCKCNNHTDSCDDITGICYNCQHNTQGSDCGQCQLGYYGNATYGTPNDCKQCACPLSVASNNFSPTCQLLADGVNLLCTNCSTGYTGQTCQSCSDGYYGNPKEINQTCRPCNCSGNINLSLQGNCNTTTGVCLKCQGNTTGDQCQVGYYGLESNSSCKSCDCHPVGSVSPLSSCDTSSGQCPCKPGIGGRDCSRCARGYWNFTKDGCAPCNCSKTGGACDASTGNCDCPPHVEGKYCDTCAPQAYGYDPLEGCQVTNTKVIVWFTCHSFI